MGDICNKLIIFNEQIIVHNYKETNGPSDVCRVIKEKVVSDYDWQRFKSLENIKCSTLIFSYVIFKDIILDNNISLEHCKNYDSTNYPYQKIIVELPPFTPLT